MNSNPLPGQVFKITMLPDLTAPPFEPKDRVTILHPRAYIKFDAFKKTIRNVSDEKEPLFRKYTFLGETGCLFCD